LLKGDFDTQHMPEKFVTEDKIVNFWLTPSALVQLLS